MERINKLLAHAGVASRRSVDALIRAGRVTVNGTIVSELGSRIDPERDAVKVDGQRVQLSGGPRVYVMLNKPRGVVTTLDDPEGRPTVKDLLRGVRARVFPVGRLDFHSEGLLLLTNDGALAQELLHPKKHAKKVYRVKVRGTPSREVLERLSRGVSLDGRRTLPAEFSLLQAGDKSWLSVTLREGRKNQIRRMMLVVRHPVTKLRRVSMAGLDLGDLPVGEFRHLTEAEIKRLKGIFTPASRRRN